MLLVIGPMTACAEFVDEAADEDAVRMDAVVTAQPRQDQVQDQGLPTPMLDAGSQPVDSDVVTADAEVQCDQPGRAGLCMFCDANGNLFQPETDRDCPELTCLSVVDFERVEESFATACVRLQSPQSARACGDLGQCANEFDYCGDTQYEAYYSVFTDGCVELVSCLDAENASTDFKAAGTDCAVSSGPRYSRIRVHVIESEDPIRFTSVKLGTVGDQGQASFPQFVTVSVIAAGQNAEMLLSGGADFTLAKDETIEIEFSMPVSVSLLTAAIELNSPVQLKVEGAIETGAWLEWDIRDIQAGTAEFAIMPRGTCNSRGECVAPDRFDCEPVLDAVNAGPLCSSSEEVGSAYCEFFVPNNGSERSCDDVCGQANLRCLGVKGDQDNDCRTIGDRDCGESMNDFVCRCGP